MTLYASDVMVKEVITVTESMPLKDVARMFVEKKITGAPVINVEGELVGVISETDIIREMMYNRRIHRVVVAEGTRIKGIVTTMDILRAIATNLKGGDDLFGTSPRA